MTVRDWLQKAKAEKFAIGAFNVGNLEIFKAIAAAAASRRSPIIIESSPGETSWLGMDNIVDLSKNFSQDFNIPIFINLDHARSWEECLKAMEVGYDLIHFDGSNLTIEENLAIAKKVVGTAHRKGILVEGELDHIAGASEVFPGSATKEIADIPMTDPEQARVFVEVSGVDILAVFIGNVHGVFSKGGEILNLELLEQLQVALPTTYFSLHGGSGIADEEIMGATERGIVKVNINTEMRKVFKVGLEEVLKENPSEYALYKVEEPIIERLQAVVEHKIDILGSANKI